MLPSKISSLDDPRLDPYRELKKANFTRRAPYFIAEGRLVTQRLLASSFQVESVLLAESKWETMREFVPPEARPLLIDDEWIDQLVGFPFHSGIMACGKRHKITTLDNVLSDRSDQRMTLVAVPESSLQENLGSIIRISAAFGCDALIVGNRGVDAFSRKVIRVSMGSVFYLPIVEPDNFESLIRQLREDHEFEVIAATLEPTAQSLELARRDQRLCLMFGNEAFGLSQKEIAGTDRQVSLEMAPGIDSLNVANAATVFLYHFTRICQEPDP